MNLTKMMKVTFRNFSTFKCMCVYGSCGVHSITLFEMAACELQLNDGNQDDVTGRIKDFVINSGIYSVRDVRDIANNPQLGRYYIRSLILYRIIDRMKVSENPSPDNEIKLIRNNVVANACSTKPVMETGGMSRDIGNVCVSSVCVYMV